MTLWDFSFLLFLLERPHRWLALRSEAKGVEAAGRTRRAGFVFVVFAVAYLESLALHVSGGAAVWAAVFWTQVAYVAVSVGARFRRRGRHAAVAVGVCVAAAGVVGARFSGADAWTWLGASNIGAAGDRASVAAPIALVVFWIAVHAGPRAIDHLRGRSRSEAARLLTGACGATLLEWYLVAKTAGFPGVLFFPDLADFSGFGARGALWTSPLWTAFHFTSIVVDVRRTFRPLSAAPCGG